MKRYKLLHGDCLEILQKIPDKSIDLIVADPPYYRRVKEDWDRQWKSEDLYIEWSAAVFDLMLTKLKYSGSFYIFCSAYMSSRLYRAIKEPYRIFNHIIWEKQDCGGAEKGLHAGSQRTFLTRSEHILYGGYDNMLGNQLSLAMRESGKSAKEVVYHLRKKYTGLVGLWTSRSTAVGFCEPCEKDWISAMRFCNQKVTALDYAKYRRKFNLNSVHQYSDIWNFERRNKRNFHPCEKPQNILRNMIDICTKKGDIVLDPFMGSGSTGVAALNMGRKFICIEKELKYFEHANNNIKHQSL